MNKKFFAITMMVGVLLCGPGLIQAQTGEAIAAPTQNSGYDEAVTAPRDFDESYYIDNDTAPGTMAYRPVARQHQRNCPMLKHLRPGTGGSGYYAGSSGTVGVNYNPNSTSTRGGNSDILQGSNAVAGGYNLIGMETFGDMFGPVGSGGGGIWTYTEWVKYEATGGMWQSSFDDFASINSMQGSTSYGDSLSISESFTAYMRTGDGHPDSPISSSSRNLSDYAKDYFEGKGLGGGIVYYERADSWLSEDGAGNIDDSQFEYYYIKQQADITAALSQSVVGRIKITENLSPLPQDRFIFDYNYFHNVPSGNTKFGVNRFTPGFEKTFMNKLMSVELRLPMAVTMDTHLNADGTTDMHSGQVGDLSITLKGLLIRRNRFVMTGGMTITAPTGKDVEYYSITGEKMLEYKNDSCHIMPYFGGLWMPNNRWFHQAYLQVDVDTNGRSVSTRQQSGANLDYNGKAYDNTYLYGSLSSGYWLYRDLQQRHGLTGWNIVGELHWTRSVDKSKNVVVRDSANAIDMYRIGNFCDSYEVLNATIGTRAVFNQRTVLGLAFGTPLTNDRQFDGEFRVSLNHYF